jgi:hypothetical protein
VGEAGESASIPVFPWAPEGRRLTFALRLPDFCAGRRFGRRTIAKQAGDGKHRKGKKPSLAGF